MTLRDKLARAIADFEAEADMRPSPVKVAPYYSRLADSLIAVLAAEPVSDEAIATVDAIMQKHGMGPQDPAFAEQERETLTVLWRAMLGVK